jgi:hypothetical protein
VELLTNSRKEHTLQDDMESFFWVLLYASLRYSPSNQESEDLANLLSTFDQVYWMSNKGGVLKGDMLIAQQVPKTVKFSGHEELDKILAELNSLFATRYEEPPSEAALEACRSLLEMGISRSVIETLPAYIYEWVQECLKAPLFMLGILREKTKARVSWPPNDAASEQVFSNSLGTDKKCEHDQAMLEGRVDLGHSKRVKLNNGSVGQVSGHRSYGGASSASGRRSYSVTSSVVGDECDNV